VLADLEERSPRPLVLIVGMLASKDCPGFLKHFVGLAQRTLAVPVPRQEKSRPAGNIADIARGLGIPAHCSTDIRSALAAVAGFGLDPPPRILITGSLYLAGEVLAENGTPPS
jgi:dihydrofolate synthase/folylpolyglutamate synthase